MSAMNAVDGGTEPAAFPPGDSGARPARRTGKSPLTDRHLAASWPGRASTDTARSSGQAHSRYQTRVGPHEVLGTPGPRGVRWARRRTGGAAVSGARHLAVGLLAGIAVLAGAEAAQAQTINPDGSATIWTAELIVSSNPGGVVNFGYFTFGNGSLTPNSFTWDDNSFRVGALGIATIVSCGYDTALELYEGFGGSWKDNSEARWVLHLDSHTFEFGDADQLDDAEVYWCGVSEIDLGWTDGDTVDVKITRKVREPISVPDGHPVVWQADITPGSGSGDTNGHEGWSTDDYGSLTGPASFEYKDGSYEVTSVFTDNLCGNAYFQLKSGSTSATELAHSSSNLSLHIGSHVLALSGGQGASTLILWLCTAVTWPAHYDVVVGISTSEPGAPGDLSAEAASATWVTLGWSVPEKPGGSAITGYEYRRSGDEGGSWGSWTSIPHSASLTSFLVTGLHADTTYTFQMRAVNGSGSGLHSETVLQEVAKKLPLTAIFEDMPDAHDGATEFKFGLTFSEEPTNIGYPTVRDHMFDMTGGEIVRVSRRDRGSNRRWRITVQPLSREAVTIELPVRRNCHLANAPCTADGRPLSRAVADTVAGPEAPSVSVADAGASEGDSVVFTVSLSVAWGEQVTVAYATAGGTATTGDDFTADNGTLEFAAEETEKTVSVQTTEDTVDEPNETFTLTLSSPTNATLGVAAATGTIVDDDAVQTALTATFGGMPDDHSGAAFTFALTFSEEIEGLSYLTLRDSAFVVSGGGVKRARRKVQGENKAWTITVRPDAATDTVAITLPATTDCQAGGAICTSDNRKLSAAVSDTVLPASPAGDRAGGGAEEDALAILDGLTPEEAAAALTGEAALSDAQLGALDRLGNRNGSYDLGDMVSWTERCRSGEARCGSTPGDPGAASSALLPFAAAAAGRRSRSGRTGRRGSRRRRARGSMLAVLLAAAAAWSCSGDLVEPPAAERDDPGVLPAPAAIPRGPGFLTVEWTAPAAGRAVGVLLELEGPGITAVEAAPGLELFHSAATGRRRIVVAGPLEDGPLVRFRVPDRGRFARYRVRILQVTGEDYALGDPTEYRAVAAPN